MKWPQIMNSAGTVPARFRVRAPFGEATLLSLHNDAPVQKRQECRFPDSVLLTSDYERRAARAAAVQAVLVGAVVRIERMHLFVVYPERGEERMWETTCQLTLPPGHGLQLF